MKKVNINLNVDFGNNNELTFNLNLNSKQKEPIIPKPIVEDAPIVIHDNGPMSGETKPVAKRIPKQPNIRKNISLTGKRRNRISDKDAWSVEELKSDHRRRKILQVFRKVNGLKLNVSRSYTVYDSIPTSEYNGNNLKLEYRSESNMFLIEKGDFSDRVFMKDYRDEKEFKLAAAVKYLSIFYNRNLEREDLFNELKRMYTKELNVIVSWD